jgi:hypothetical protein
MKLLRAEIWFARPQDNSPFQNGPVIMLRMLRKAYSQSVGFL